MAILFNSRKHPGLVVIKNSERPNEFAIISPIKKSAIQSELDKGNTHVLLQSEPEGLIVSGISKISYHQSYEHARRSYLLSVRVQL